MDPLVTHLCAAVLGLVLLGSAWSHARDLELFRHAIGGYALLPVALEAPAAWALTAAEAAAGLALLPVATRGLGATLAAAVLLVVTAGVVVNLRRGRRDIDCGCGGASSTPLSWGLVARNAVLLGLAAVAALPAATRPVVWLDAVALVAGALFGLGLHAAANQLLANQPRLEALRTQP